DDLNDPQPTNANPTSSTSNALTADGIGAPEPSTIAPVGGNAPAVPVGGLDPAINPIADSGGEDEDLEDLEIQRLTPRAGAVGMVAPDDALTNPVVAPFAATTVQPLAVDDVAAAVLPSIDDVIDPDYDDDGIDD
ncbi:MAG TPA: hypothetical protein VL916_08010, partial [Ilumatobacteraceae bacterium]|nr:hypothetical protein [Ilumatobacteraceae bacterium]